MTGNTRQALGSVLVVGDGLVGLITAIAMRSALPKAHVVLAGRGKHAASLSDTLPLVTGPVLEILDVLGLREDSLVCHGVAMHRVADRFSGWGAKPFTVSTMDHDLQLGGAAMHQLWLAHDRTTPFDDLTVGAAATGLGRFAPDAFSPEAVAAHPTLHWR
jgi:tryptophan halogenase